MEAFLNFGSHNAPTADTVKVAIETAGPLILSILDARCDEETKRTALKLLAGAVTHTTNISGVTIGDSTFTNTPGGRLEPSTPIADSAPDEEGDSQ